jgi:glycosyltransferase involved in cell wall biosynthesis
MVEQMGGLMATSPVTQSKEPSEASVASVGQTTPRIAIFIVAYNAEATLAKVLMRIPEQVMAKVDEIFVFDDASQDNTFRVGQSLQEDSLAPWSGKLVVHRHPINLMYGGNQRHGYLYAMGVTSTLWCFCMVMVSTPQYARIANAVGKWCRRYGDGFAHALPGPLAAATCHYTNSSATAS